VRGCSIIAARIVFVDHELVSAHRKAFQGIIGYLMSDTPLRVDQTKW
jgi:hypothetical protein